MVFYDRGPKRGSISVSKILGGNGHILMVMESFRTVMNCKVLRCGNDFQVFGIVSLEIGDESNADAARKKRIFAVGFLAAAPARIAKNVDVGRSKREAVVAFGI